jgi:hypothetical protein
MSISADQVGHRIFHTPSNHGRVHRRFKQDA